MLPGLRSGPPGLLLGLLLALALGLATVLAGCGGAGSDPGADGEASAAVPRVLTGTAPGRTQAPHADRTPSGGRSPDPASSAVPSITIPSLSLPGRNAYPAGAAVEGADVSWPQCPKGMGIAQKRSQGAPMPLGSARFVVLGLTNGPGFVANPCLADQLAWAQARHLLVSAYAVISGPYGDVLARYGRTGPFDAGTAAGRLANMGYQEALFNIVTMRTVGLRTPLVWLDVEPVAHFDWSSDTAANAAVVRGAARGYTDHGYGIGVYSIASLWRRVVGDLQLAVPEWRPAGGAGRAEALRRCGGESMFAGGAAVLAQWVEDGRDRDVTCPGQAPYLSMWFHQE